MSKYDQIKNDISKLSEETRGSDKFVVSAVAHEVDAFELLDQRMEDLQTGIKSLNRTTTRLMMAQIVLIVVQVILAIAAFVLSKNL